MSANKKPPENEEQSKRFVETAKKLEADETGSVFERAVKAIAKKAEPLKPKK